MFRALARDCLRRPHFYQQRKKWGKERRQKPMVFGFPFASGRCVLIRPKCGIDVFLCALPLLF